jgi:NADPH:quinone reductase-like Zn-dependent oxidoreductase
MKAIVHDRYGSPDVLELRDIPEPDVDDEQVLVAVHAASVNALDFHATRGMPWLMRLDGSFRKPSIRVRGVDLAGRVMAIGRNVTGFKPGDKVFGSADGSFAEYAATVPKRLAHMPEGMSYEVGATLNVAGSTALQGLQGRANLQPGQRVIINGAGGGVGTMAVQIAKALGAHVTAVTRTESMDIVKAIGADDVVDHHKEDFTRRSARCDVLFDIGGRFPLTRVRQIVVDNGMVLVAGGPAGRIGPADRLLAALLLNPFCRQRIVPFISKIDPVSLAFLAELTASGRIKPVIERVYPLEQTAAAVRHLGAGHVCGKIVVQVRDT